MAAAQYFEQVQKIFIAFYQRPADPAGLKYWAERVDAAGGDINQVINAFASSPEAVALYGAIDATTDAAAIRTVIDKLYLALFNAADTFDAAGKQFYVDGFMAGTFTAGTIALSVLNGAQNDDLIAVNNKVQVANEFTQQVDGRPMSNAYFGNGTSFNVTYAGDADAVAARGILKNVTFLPSTVISPSAVTEVLKTQIADATDPIQGQTGGQTFTLTAGTDLADSSSSSRSGIDTSASFKFSNGNEKVIAGAGTLGNNDVLLDGSTEDNDVLEATISGATGTATIQNVETIKLNMAAGAAEFKMDNVSGVKHLEVKGAVDGIISAVGKPTADLTIADYNKTLSLTGLTLTGTAATNDADSMTVNLSGTGAKAGLTLNGGAQALETLKLNSTGEAANTLNLGAAGGTTVDKILVEGGADLTLRAKHTDLSGKEVDASDNTGTFTLVVDRDGATPPTSASNFVGVDKLVLRDSNTSSSHSASVNNLADQSNVVFATSFGSASTLTVKGAAAKADNVLNLTAQNETANTDTTLVGLTVANVETINIVSEGAKTQNTFGTLTVNDAKVVTVDGSSKFALTLDGASKVSTVEITGSGDHSFDFSAAAQYAEGKNLTVDASAATGKLSIDVSDFAGTTGGGSAVETATVLAGTGNDIITLGAATNGKYVVDAGDGKDTIVVTKGSTVNLTTGAGSDTIKLDLSGGATTTNLVVTDFTAGASGDVFSTKGQVTAVNFDNTGLDFASGEIFVYTGGGLDGVTAATLDTANITSIDAGTAQKGILVVLNNNTGFAEAYAVTSDGTNDGWTGDTVTLIGQFENITTLTGISALTADNFAVFA